MTFLEKAMAEHPGLDEGDIISFMCPCDFGYEKLNDGCAQPGGNVMKKCKACWNREAPDGPPRASAPTGSGEGGAGNGD